MAQSSIDYLAMDIDKLFEQYRVEEVQQILQKMRAESDRKREDLRVTVGNRYRDLIEAADTICEMKNTATGIMSNLHKMETQMVNFKHRQLVGFRTEEQLQEKTRDLAQSRKEYLSLAAQVRLLMDLPERVWNLLDVNDFCKAAQVLQFAQHLHTGLLFETGSGNNSEEKNITSWFPVVNRQWAAVSSFNEVIIKLCLNSLRKPQLCTKEAANSLCAVLLLEGLNGSELLQKFVQLRTEAIQNFYTTSSQSNIKQKITSFIRGISETLIVIHSLFAEGFTDSDLPQAMVSEVIKSITQPGAPYTVHHLNLPTGAILKYLPPVISEFRPNFREPWQPLTLSELRQRSVDWYETMKLWIKERTSDFLSCVTSIKTLAGIREAAYVTIQDDPCLAQWEELSTRLLGKKVSLWDDLLRPCVVQRIRGIIHNQMDGIFASVTSSMKQRAQEILTSESDFTQWLWTELAADLPQRMELSLFFLRHPSQHLSFALAAVLAYLPC